MSSQIDTAGRCLENGGQNKTSDTDCCKQYSRREFVLLAVAIFMCTAVFATTFAMHGRMNNLMLQQQVLSSELQELKASCKCISDVDKNEIGMSNENDLENDVAQESSNANVDVAEYRLKRNAVRPSRRKRIRTTDNPANEQENSGGVERVQGKATDEPKKSSRKDKMRTERQNPNQNGDKRDKMKAKHHHQHRPPLVHPRHRQNDLNDTQGDNELENPKDTKIDQSLPQRPLFPRRQKFLEPAVTVETTVPSLIESDIFDDKKKKQNNIAISLYGDLNKIEEKQGHDHVRQDQQTGNVKFVNTGGRLLYWQPDPDVNEYMTKKNVPMMPYNETNGEVTIPEDGVYLVYSQVTVFGQVTYYEKTLAVQTAIMTETPNRRVCPGSLANSEERKVCAVIKSREQIVMPSAPSANNDYQYRTTTLNTLVFLAKGTKVWIADDINVYPDISRNIVFDRSFTFWGIYKTV